MATNMEFLDPRAEPGLPVESYDLRIKPTAPGLAIGLLANGFPDSVAFLEELGTAIEKRLPNAKVTVFDKGNPSVIADDHLLTAVKTECHAVVTAYGH